MSRIIAGRRKGQRLRVPASGTRPTSDRVREALFSAVTVWAGRVGEDVDTGLTGLGWLDLCAGSGAVGLEAASRGAGPVVLVESDPSAARVAAENARRLHLRADVRTTSMEAFARQPATRAFEVVWLDPPYAVPTPAVDRVLADLVASGWVAEDALIVVERSARSAPPTWPAGTVTSRRRDHGETVLHEAAWDPREDQAD